MKKDVSLFKNILKMQVTIELLNDHALNLLRDLEQMSIIRFLKTETDVKQPSLQPSKSRFAGRISKATAEKLHHQLIEVREEWND
jgi:hypothetical protein